MKKSDSKSFFERIKIAFNKNSKINKEKKKKKEKEKRNKPQGYTARRLGQITFWILFTFMFLFVFVNLLGVGKKQEKTEPTNNVMSKIATYEGVEFAKDFLHKYFNVSNEKSKDLREETLSKYLAKNVSGTNISISKDETMKLNKNNILLKDIEYTNDKNARMTFFAKVSIERKLTKDERKNVKEHDGYLEKEDIDKEELDYRISGKKLIRDLDLYTSVPIQLTDDGLLIYELPSLTYLSDEDDGKESENKFQDLSRIRESASELELDGFLNTFFETFSQDSKDKLSYILEDEGYEIGLGESYEFVEVSDAVFYEGKTAKEYIVDVDVVFREPNTGMEIMSNYMLVIKQSGSRYIVQSINNDEYILELLDKANSEEEEEGEEKDDKDDKEDESDNEDDVEEDVEDEDTNSDDEESTVA